MRSFGIALCLALSLPLIQSGQTAHAAPVIMPETIEAIFARCVERIDEQADAVVVRIDRVADSSVIKLERLVSRGATEAVVQRTATKLKQSINKSASAIVPRLNREVSTSMIRLRRHAQYEPHFHDDLLQARDEAYATVDAAVAEAIDRIDDVISPAAE